ncbi:hypothetical protein L208DRAFT_1536290 [Tricholoma matsutake]|nr:hypothetical protein L208DRAFT_1536290 [Tricholoma matsutake 945]
MKTCSMFATRELKNEESARKHKQATQKKNIPGQKNPPNPRARGWKGLKEFNMSTYKYHALGDVANTIREYGTTESYPTELGELEHRTVKSRYKRMSKKNYLNQLAQIERRQAHVHQIRRRLNAGKASHYDEAEYASSPMPRYCIGKSQNEPVVLPVFLQDNRGDPAVKDFLPRLKAHLLHRIQLMVQQEASSALHLSSSSRDPCSNGINHVLFKSDRIYNHQLVRIYYTAYDVCRAQDVLNPNTTHHNIMVLNSMGEQCHPYLHACILGVYHANIIYVGPGMVDYSPR